MDPRIVKLADLLVDYSCRVQTGDKVLIDYEGDCCKDHIYERMQSAKDERHAGLHRHSCRWQYSRTF